LPIVCWPTTSEQFAKIIVQQDEQQQQ